MPTPTKQNAAFIIKHHGLIAHQTDTIYGLACLPKHELLTRLTRIKQRPKNKTFLLLASSYQQVAAYINVDSQAIELLTKPTQTPTTWLVPVANNVSPHLIGDSNKIAVRLSHFQPIKLLCEQVGAIASTSANISNHPACTHAQQIRTMFGPGIDYVDPNQTTGTGRSSTIVDLLSGAIIRE